MDPSAVRAVPMAMAPRRVVPALQFALRIISEILRLRLANTSLRSRLRISTLTAAVAVGLARRRLHRRAD